MRKKASSSGFRCVLFSLILLGPLCGCKWKEIFPPITPTLPNEVAVDRALKLCALTHSEKPFHLVLLVAPPPRNHPSANQTASFLPRPDMRATVELFWLNPITYRLVIHTSQFSQIRIVNGPMVEEENIGDFYPRWLQNFVDALLDPVPHLDVLRDQEGSIPISHEAHACISTPTNPHLGADETSLAQICFEGDQPLLASSLDYTRSVSFDDFQPFGTQLVPRTVINDLPANYLLRGRITVLKPLRQSDYPLLKALHFTPREQQFHTTLVPRSTALALLDPASLSTPFEPAPHRLSQPVSYPLRGSVEPPPPVATDTHAIVYIRTDRTGQVREAYPDSADVYHLQVAAVAQALTLKFKPLVVNGIPQQMEAPLELP